MKREEIVSQIKYIYYHRAPEIGHTVAIVVFKNGCSVVGEARKVLDPDGFNKDLGGKVSYEDALLKAPKVLAWWETINGH